MSRRNLSLLLSAIALAVLCRSRDGVSPHPRYVAEAYERIDHLALERPDRQQLLDGAMRGMVGVLNRQGDEHSQYIDPRRAQPFLDQMRQEFGGIGVRFRLVGDPQRLLLVGMPEPGSPASRAGVLPNDQVLKIDGVDVTGMSQDEIVDRMRGKRGDELVLTILHHDAEQAVEVRMVREQINVASVIGDRRLSDGVWRFQLNEDPRIAYVRLINFGNKTVEELEDTLNRLNTVGMRALIFDVRDNSGGALDAAVGVSDLFLPTGAPIVETRGRRNVVEDSYSATAHGLSRQPPMVVLINENSASASEIVAAALQDNGRAKVAGQRSFGKGTVQQIIPVEAGNSYLKLTTSSYWRPSGRDIHRRSTASELDDWGVRPDPEFAVELDEVQRRDWLLWRAYRDLTVFDAETDEVLSTADLEEEPPEQYEDRVLLRALEHLQIELDSGL